MSSFTALTNEKFKPIGKTRPLPVDATLSNGIVANFVSDTQAHTPSTGYVFCAIQFLTDSVINAYLPAMQGNTFTGVTIPAGTIIYQELTSITLTSGSCIAYRKLA